MARRVLSACEFPEANDVLKSAPGDEDRVYDLPIHRSEYGVISCWELTEEQLEDMIKTRKIYLKVCGRTHPPLLLASDIFDESEVEPGHGEEEANVDH